MEQRFEVALLLSDGMIYNDILSAPARPAPRSAGSTALNYGAEGYTTVLPRAKEKRKADGKL